jgi:ribosome maturation factor RimP
MSVLAEKIENFLSPLAETKGMEVIDVEFVKENGKRVIRVYIDKNDGIDIDDCADMSHLFSEALDEAQLVAEHYILEVSSPGIDRVIKKEKDFVKFKGAKIKLSTIERINNQRNFLGILEHYDNGVLVINDVTNGKVEIQFNNIQKARLEPDF